MEDNLSVRFLVRKVIEPIRLVILAQNRLIGILEQVRKPNLIILEKMKCRIIAKYRKITSSL